MLNNFKHGCMLMDPMILCSNLMTPKLEKYLQVDLANEFSQMSICYIYVIHDSVTYDSMFFQEQLDVWRTVDDVGVQKY